MLIRNLTAEHVYLACGRTDMRKSIDGLAALVLSKFQLDPHQPALFLFCGRRKDRIKGLLWDETGFLLLYKRLENGQYQWPDTPEDLLEISERQYSAAVSPLFCWARMICFQDARECCCLSC
jgi:transposase